MTESEMKKLGYEIVDYIVEHFQGDSYGRPTARTNPSEQVLDRLPTEGEAPSALFAELNGLLKQNHLNIDHLQHPSSNLSHYYSILADT